MITQKHPCRRRLAGLTTTNNYYETKGEFVHKADEILADYGWTLDAFNMPYDSDRCTAFIVEEETYKQVGGLFISWYRMPSGRYEITTYVV